MKLYIKYTLFFFVALFSLPLLSSVGAPLIIDLAKNPENVSIVYGDDAGDALGGAYIDGISFGNLNNDSYNDIICGAWFSSPGNPPIFEAGTVYILYGENFSDGSLIDLNTSPTGSLTSFMETRIWGDDQGDQIGQVVACGDINGDQYDDVIIGAEGNPGNPNRHDAGEIYIIYGNTFSPESILNLDTTTSGIDSLTTASETRILGDKENDFLGRSLAVGDINSDGFEDIISGADSADFSYRYNAGETFVFYGRLSLPCSVLDMHTSPTGSISVAGETRILGDDSGDHAGFSVASGDINGDGYDDIIMGIPGGSPLNRLSAGEVYVVYGSENLMASIVDMASNDAITSLGETRIFGDDSGDEFGTVVASGDINGDGFDDVLMGVFRGSPGNPIRSNAGEVYVIYGGAQLPGKIIDLDTTAIGRDAISSAGETRILGANANDFTGVSLGVGDVNSDGLVDLIIGADEVFKFENGKGKVFVIYGSREKKGKPSGEGSLIDLSKGLEYLDILVLGMSPLGRLGNSCVGGADVNKDGSGDFASAAIWADNPSIGGDNNSGEVITVFGETLTTTATAVEYFKVGYASKKGLGGRLSPTLRCWMAFHGGDNGMGKASVTTATLTRSNEGLSNLPLSLDNGAANVAWHIQTNRVGFTTASLTLKYLNSEIELLLEETLQLYQAPTSSGPRSLIPLQSLNPRRNEIHAIITSFGYFVIIGNLKKNSWIIY